MDRNNQGRHVPSRPSLGQSTPTGQSVSVAKESRGQSSKNTSGGWLKYIVSGLLVLAVIMVMLWFFGSTKSINSSIDHSKYQAVFTVTGEVYFGKLTILPDDYYKLTDVYYIQKKTTQTEGVDTDIAKEANNLELIKLGNEMHGPEDTMFLNRSQVLYFENLKTDGTITIKITEEKKQSR